MRLSGAASKDPQSEKQGSCWILADLTSDLFYMYRTAYLVGMHETTDKTTLQGDREAILG
jgi:hypothetical protein